MDRFLITGGGRFTAKFKSRRKNAVRPPNMAHAPQWRSVRHPQRAPSSTTEVMGRILTWPVRRWMIEGNTVRFHAKKFAAWAELRFSSAKMRGSIAIRGPCGPFEKSDRLIARRGVIGRVRSILHLRFEALGAKIQIANGYVEPARTIAGAVYFRRCAGSPCWHRQRDDGRNPRGRREQ